MNLGGFKMKFYLTDFKKTVKVNIRNEDLIDKLNWLSMPLLYNAQLPNYLSLGSIFFNDHPQIKKRLQKIALKEFDNCCPCCGTPIEKEFFIIL